ncbi:hypothetical protein M1N23_00520 [Dehalococcoidia bacterium]|nr:hypothetical protein [Dehalococcoidia bacterium]
MSHVRERNRKMLIMAGLLCLAVTTLTAVCGDDKSNAQEDFSRGTITDTNHVVEVSHTSFKPLAATISAGDMIIFRNIVDMSRPLISKKAGLDTGKFPKGERSVTFEKPGHTPSLTRPTRTS